MKSEKGDLFGNLVKGAVLGVVLLVMAILFNLGKETDGKLRIVFCDVGQGDAILIRTPSKKDILIDGGPDDKILNCLSKNLPFYDREIDMVFLTHPQADHLTGLISVLERYKVDYFISSVVDNNSAGYKKLKELVNEKNIQVQNPYLGKEIDFTDGVKMKILWPEKEFVLSHLELASREDATGGGNEKVLGVSDFRGDLNEISTVMMIDFGNFQAVLTGDADKNVQEKIISDNNLFPVEVLKIPHHGSKTGLTDKFLEILKPNLAVISVGKNSFGHPTKEILDKLRAINIKIERTDEIGDIEIVSDGKMWYYPR